MFLFFNCKSLILYLTLIITLVLRALATSKKLDLVKLSKIIKKTKKFKKIQKNSKKFLLMFLFFNCKSL